jgi:hypothetical protein
MRAMDAFPIGALEDMRDTLYQKLEKGYDWIEAKLEQGEDTAEAEEHWTGLLKQYETVTEEIRKKIGESEA